MNQNAISLAEILLDRSLSIEVRDDAAMDLGEFDDAVAFSALVTVGTDPLEDDCILWSCGDSLADIWRRRGEYELNVFNALRPAAKQEAQSTVDNLKAI